jgi:isochorismate synthase EntC
VAKHPGGEVFRLDLVALADHDAPAIIRLRHVLKALLRHYNFRCKAVEQLHPPAAASGVAQDAAADASAASEASAEAGPA